MHPLARLTVRQTRRPAGAEDRALRRRHGARHPLRHHARPRSAASRPSTTPVTDQFAAAQFLELSDDEKLARPSFEPMPAGVTFAGGDITFGSQSAVSEMDFDRRIDGARTRPRRSAERHAGDVRRGFGPAGRSALREPDSAGQDLAISAERFVVAGVDDLSRDDDRRRLVRRRPPGARRPPRHPPRRPPAGRPGLRTTA